MKPFTDPCFTMFLLKCRREVDLEEYAIVSKTGKINKLIFCTLNSQAVKQTDKQ
jgi:hypothetical protein